MCDKLSNLRTGMSKTVPVGNDVSSQLSKQPSYYFDADKLQVQSSSQQPMPLTWVSRG